MIIKMSDEEYFAHPAMGSSQFKPGTVSMKLMKHGLDNPTKGSGAMDLGSLVHCLALEPELFHDRFKLFDETVGLKTKAADAFRAKLRPGENMYTPQIKEQADAMVACIADFPLPDPEHRELSAFSTIKGVDAKAKADWLSEDNWLWDLKTSNKLGIWEYIFDKFPALYDIQAGWYYTIFKNLNDDIEGFKWLVVGSTEPYDYRVFTCSRQTMADAQMKISDTMEKYKVCLETGIWEGYDKEPKEV